MALVGHEPDLGIALGQALGAGPVALPKGAVAALERGGDGTWTALGLLRPASSCWEPLGAKGAAAAAASEAHGKRERKDKQEAHGKHEKVEKQQAHAKHEKQDKRDRHDKAEDHVKPAKASEAAQIDQAARTSEASKAEIPRAGNIAKGGKSGKTPKTSSADKSDRADRKTQPAANAEPTIR